MKYIFTIATNVYTYYFENFKNTINNFYPNEDKTLVVFSDSLQEYNNYQIGNTLIKIISIPKLLYTSIMFNRFSIFENYLEKNNIDKNTLIYHFDIDTYFYDNCEFAYQELTNIINEHIDSVIFSNDPNNLVFKQLDYKDNKYYQHGIIIKNLQYSSVLDDYSFYKNGLLWKDCICSFFCGTLSSIKKLNKIFKEYCNKIIDKDKKIPIINDEDIVNYIWLKQLIGDIQEKYIYVTDNSLININKQDKDNKEYYININVPWEVKLNQNYIDHFICNQKYDKIKSDQR